MNLIQIKTSLLDSKYPEIVTIDGVELCTEEAAITWEQMTVAERAEYQGMTDIQIVAAIYAKFFGYLKIGAK